jgi:hypothetical protein
MSPREAGCFDFRISPFLRNKPAIRSSDAKR